MAKRKSRASHHHEQTAAGPSFRRQSRLEPRFLEDLQFWVQADPRIADRILDLVKRVREEVAAASGKGNRAGPGTTAGLSSGEKAMSDLQRLVAKLKAEDPAFAERYERGYQSFRLGSLLQEAREQAGMTQEQVAQRLRTKKSAISRIENHAGDMRLSTIQRYAETVGLELVLELREPVEAQTAKPGKAVQAKRVVSAGSAAPRSRATPRAAHG